MNDEITEASIVSSGAKNFVSSCVVAPRLNISEEEKKNALASLEYMSLGAESINPSIDPDESDSYNFDVDDFIPEDDDSIEGSDTGNAKCIITFSYLDTDGVEKIFLQESVDYGTPYSEVILPNSIIAPPDGFPSRTSGYWIFTGWTENFSSATKIVTGNITSKAKFEPATVKIPLNWNGAEIDDSSSDDSSSDDSSSDTVDDYSYLECTWGSKYVNLPILPTKSGNTFSGAYLITNTLNQVITRTHDASGNGISIVGSKELGAGTTNVAGTVFEAPSCKVTICWFDPIKWNNQGDLRDAVGTIPCPFASDESATVAIPATDTDANGISFDAGFPSAYTKPIIDPSTGEVNDDARVITRRQVNTLGYIGTQEQFFAQCGGYHTFDEDICAAIGGYPESAILRFFDETNNCLRTVYSLMDNNTWNFLTDGVDGVHWKYIDDNPILSMRVDYSDFLDLRNTLFVETGLPDFYELPYDGMLQLHALSFCDMHSTLRDEEEYIADVRTGIEKKDTEGGFTPVYEDVQGAFATRFDGVVYLDIYNAKTNTITSSEIRKDGSLIFGASVFDLTMGSGAYYYYKMPRYVVTQGTFLLNKGDKIRVRGVYKEEMATEKLGDPNRVFPRVLSDMEVRRFYLCKFANFYRVGWEA